MQGTFRRLLLTQDRRLNLFWRVAIALVSYVPIVIFVGLLDRLLLMYLLGWSQENADAVGALCCDLALCGWFFFLRTRVDKRSWKAMRLTPLKSAARFLPLGIALGIACQGLVFCVEYGLGWIHIVGTEIGTIGLAGAARNVLLGLVITSVPGFGEELMARGYLFQNLGRTLPLWLATILTGVLFGLLHFVNGGGFGVAFVVDALGISTIFILFRLRTGTLWLAIGFHIAWDWSENSVFGLEYPNTAYAHHSLLYLQQSGPALLVGTPPLIEAGLIWAGVVLLVLVLSYLWTLMGGKWIDWRVRLDDEGQPPVTPEGISVSPASD